MFSICKNFIKVNDDLFLVKRTFKEEDVKNLDLAKELLGTPHVFRNNWLFYFTEKIEELELITE